MRSKLMMLVQLSVVSLMPLASAVDADRGVVDKENSSFRFQYAAKFICTSNLAGTSQTTPSFRPGSYRTAINVHNPDSRTVRLRKKLALVNPFEQEPGEVSKFIHEELASDQALAVNCERIADFDLEILPMHGIEGFLVIESTKSLDVIAVYTAGGPWGTVETGDDGSQRVESIAVEQVKERKISHRSVGDE